MAATIAIESPFQDDVRTMVAALNAYLRLLSPSEFQFQMTAEQMAGDDTTVFVGRDDRGRAVGLGALKRHGAAFGEVKRMWTTPAIRGSGLGWRILQAIEARAREDGLALLVLETGATPGFEPAWTLYERSGFSRRGAFLDYPDSGYSRFYEKSLSA